MCAAAKDGDARRPAQTGQQTPARHRLRPASRLGEAGGQQSAVADAENLCVSPDVCLEVRLGGEVGVALGLDRFQVAYPRALFQVTNLQAKVFATAPKRSPWPLEIERGKRRRR